MSPILLRSDMDRCVEEGWEGYLWLLRHYKDARVYYSGCYYEGSGADRVLISRDGVWGSGTIFDHLVDP